jgi:hypothetical protein
MQENLDFSRVRRIEQKGVKMFYDRKGPSDARIGASAMLANDRQRKGE